MSRRTFPGMIRSLLVLGQADVGASMKVGAPVLAVGGGALGFWAALREVFPQTNDHWDDDHLDTGWAAPVPSADGVVP